MSHLKILLVFLQILSQAVTVAPLGCVLLEHGSVAISAFFIQMSWTGQVLLPVTVQAGTGCSAVSKTKRLGNFNWNSLGEELGYFDLRENWFV
jgi:hypothetical protein